jgi:secondary thiamine-phosphate synthase enzyme
MTNIELDSRQREELIDITADIQAAVRVSKVKDGICLVFIPHTTAAVTINENADPDVKKDILMALKKAVPDNLPWDHGEGNSPAHVKASLVGSSVMVIVEGGRLRLGTWQGVTFCEFDGPRRRQVFIEIR